MSPGERAAPGRREAARPQYATTAPGFPPPYYPPYGVPHPNAWLGAPLISMAGRAPLQNRNTPVSKLAVQAQGVPLIIKNRQDRRKFVSAPEQRNHRPANNEHVPRDRCDTSEGNKLRNQQHPSRSTRGGRNNNTDAVSVASDESSGSTNSETMLPRIIKPRKRRKKDRKPNNIVPHELAATNLDLGDVDHCVSSGIAASHGMYDEPYCRENSMPYRVNIKVVDYAEHVPDSYRVSVLEEALEATRYGLMEAVSPAESAVSSCQCRLCDPVGQIWDTDSIADLLNENSCGDFAPTKLEDSMKVVGSLGRRGVDTTLRRSWSDPSSRVPERRETSNETFSSPNLYSLFPPTRRVSSPEPRSPLALEISSEIVTSLNGQRDLEIKLFSTSPPATNSDRRSFFHDKSESAVNKRIIASYDLKVNSALNRGRVECSVKMDDRKIEDAPETVCSSAFVSGEPARNICDLALVTA